MFVALDDMAVPRWLPAAYINASYHKLLVQFINKNPNRTPGGCVGCASMVKVVKGLRDCGGFGLAGMSRVLCWNASRASLSCMTNAVMPIIFV